MRVSRTNRLKSSPPTRHSVTKQGGAAIGWPRNVEPDLRIEASSQSEFNDIGVARGFLSPGGAPKSGVKIEYDQAWDLYLVWLNKKG